MSEWSRRAGRRSAEKHPFIWSIITMAIMGTILYFMVYSLAMDGFRIDFGDKSIWEILFVLFIVLWIILCFVGAVVTFIQCISKWIKSKSKQNGLEKKDIVLGNGIMQNGIRTTSAPQSVSNISKPSESMLSPERKTKSESNNANAIDFSAADLKVSPQGEKEIQIIMDGFSATFPGTLDKEMATIVYLVMFACEAQGENTLIHRMLPSIRKSLFMSYDIPGAVSRYSYILGSFQGRKLLSESECQFYKTKMLEYVQTFLSHD